MLLIGSSLIPLYLVALGLLSVFYQKYHVWKKEGISVGFVYDRQPKVKLISRPKLELLKYIFLHIVRSRFRVGKIEVFVDEEYVTTKDMCIE